MRHLDLIAIMAFPAASQTFPGCTCTHKHIPETAPEDETTLELLMCNENPNKKSTCFLLVLCGEEKVGMLTNRLV